MCVPLKRGGGASLNVRASEERVASLNVRASEERGASLNVRIGGTPVHKKHFFKIFRNFEANASNFLLNYFFNNKHIIHYITIHFTTI